MTKLITDNINFMKKSITRHKDLIPHEDALELATRVQAGLDVIEACGYPRKYDRTAVENLRLDPRVYLGLKARNTLVTGNLRFALKKAHYYNGSGLNGLDDVVQAVNLKLAEAIEKYDPTKGFKITTYLDFFVKQAVFAEKKKYQATSLKVSTHLLQIKYTFSYRVEKLRLKLGRTPSKQEVAEEYKVSVAVLDKALAIPHDVSIFDSKGTTSDGDVLTILETIESPDYCDAAKQDLTSEYARAKLNPTHLAFQQMLYPELFSKLRNNERLSEADLAVVNQILVNIDKRKI